MDPSPAVKAAAYNNAVWCNTVCTAHQNPGVFEWGIWFTTGPAPRYYPNAVTFDRSSDHQMLAIRRLIDSEMLEHVAIKDSLLIFDFTVVGFERLFEARWIWQDSETLLPHRRTDGLRWEIVKTVDELTRWEEAWDGLAAGEHIEPSARIFLPALLNDPDVLFIAGYQDQALVAGAIGNRSGKVAGLSNQFAPDDQRVDCWAGCIRMIRTAYPGLPIVGYERGNDLNLALDLGFKTVGALQVWAR
jgi:hypothetical protein